MKVIKYLILVLAIVLFTLSKGQSQLLFQLGNQGDTHGKAITIDKDSNFIIAGTFQGTLNFNPKGSNELTSNLGSTDVFIAKYDKKGNFKWVKNIGTTGVDIPTAVKTDNTGNIVIAGYFGSENLPGRFIDLDPGPKEAKFYGEGGIDAFIVKLNSSGEYQWGFLITNKDSYSTEIIWDIAINKSGQIYLSGIFAGTVDFNPKGNRKLVKQSGTAHGYFTSKYERSGENLWITKIGANITNPFDEGFSSIDLDANDGCIVAGNFRDTARFEPDIDNEFLEVSSGSSDMFIAKYSSLGKITFRGGFGGKQQDRIFPGCGKIGTDGNFYLSGNFIGKADFYPGFATREIENKNQSKQIFLSSYTLSGTLRWAYTFNSDAEDDVPMGLDFDSEGYVYLSGYFTGATNFNPKGDKTLTSKGISGASDGFLAKFDNLSNLIWANQYGDKITGKDKYDRYQFTSIDAIKIDFDDNALVTGKFYGTVDFDPSNEISALTVHNIFDMFFAKYDYDGYLWFEGGSRPKLKLISPNGGEIWNVDSTRIITWSSKNVELLRIEYSIDDGNNWILISDSVSASSGTFSWVVEDTPSSDCRIKITDLKDMKLFDISNGKFEITSEVKPSRVIFTWGNLGPVSGKAVAVDSKNNFVVTGSFQGTINCDQGNGLVNLTAKGSQDVVLAKYNEFGDLIWAFNFGSAGVICEPKSIALDGSDNIYVAGHYGRAGDNPSNVDFSKESKIDTISTLGGYDAFIAKYNKDGNFIWAFNLGNSLGNTNETINSISVENNGTIYVCGVFNGSVDFDPTKTVHKLTTKGEQPELFIAKYNSEGKYSWALNLNTKMSDAETEGMASVKYDGTGGCFVSGNFRDSVNFHPLSVSGHWMKSKAETDIFLARYKSNGYLDWALQIESNGKDLTSSNCLTRGNGNLLYLTGVFDGRADFYPGLMTKELTSTNNNPDIFIASYTTGGNFNWVRKIPSVNGYDFPKAITLDTSQNIVLTGYFTDDINFGDEKNSVTFTSLGKNGASDIFLAKFDSKGIYVWANQFGTDTSGTGLLSEPNSMVIDKSNNIIITGTFFGNNFDFDGSQEKFLLSSQDRNDAFIAKYFENGMLWIQEPDTTQLFLIKPNGGEKLFVNNLYDIKWQSKFIEKVGLKYSIDGGKNWIQIVDSIKADIDFFTWLVPDQPSENCKILVYNPNNLRKMDVSSKPFIITDKYLELISPNGTEQIISGTKQDIQWKSNKIEFINIYFTSNSGISWEPLALYYNSSLGSMTWTGREINSQKCKIKIVDVSNPEFSDSSDNYFSMKKSKISTIKLIKPIGGETFLIGWYNDIFWESDNVDSIKIELSTNNGLYWETIADKVPITENKYSWNTNSEIYKSDSCLIRVSESLDSTIFDLSDSLFRIDFDIHVERNELNDLNIENIYPQPADYYMIVQLNSEKAINCNFTIFNSLMEPVEQSKISVRKVNDKKFFINLTDLSSGLYFLNITSGNQIIRNKFMILK
ncbi:T9SS C-terminal target domain-containing protein [Bacteroidetes/Chlorobi group bacterium ChocPot_Mid]|nr:MAG: T9SS C-terminal target domain-containing protein [Bacteroidetes/Chlorobi group bacterium ChocPot_Mid]